MMIHFCGVAVCNYDKDTIVMESESDTEGEKEDSKKEDKIISSSICFSCVSETDLQLDGFDKDGHWKVPHLEISNPPPELA